jgi:P-aminobenzoate N-oxygenase AurF
VDGGQRLDDVANRLSEISRQSRYDPYTVFDWPDSLPADQYWLSPELMTCHGTRVWDELGEDDRTVLSHCEAVSFFSLNVHLIRELIGAVAERIYTTRYPGLSEFFHDFIAEENVHAWFFATFCRRYGGKVYPARLVAARPATEQVACLLDLAVFGRILIAEELCDFFNTAMASDQRLPAICQQINRVHHQDESRHIAFGRQIVRALSQEAHGQASAEQLEQVGNYLARYVTTCIRTFYNREMYADAGISDPAAVRRQLLATPERSAMHKQMMGRTVDFLSRIGVVDAAAVQW